MTGLLVFGTYLLYLLISIAMTACAANWAQRRGRRPLLWGGLVGLIMYHLLFWDLIPTYVVYNYYCDNKSGIWVYKTVEEWKTENPGVGETLTWTKRAPKYQAPNVTRGYKLNERIVWVIIDHPTPLIPVNAQEERLLDIQTGETLVKYVRIYSGYHSGINEYLKMYVSRRQSGHLREGFSALLEDYGKLGKERP